MSVIGSVIINALQQPHLRSRQIEILRAALLPRVREKARVGDLIWVKEPYVIYSSRQYGPQNQYWVVPGDWREPPPNEIRHIVTQLRRRIGAAANLERADSRATLEIERITSVLLICTVHMMQVDALVEKRRAA